jgi:hypothetical protein
LCGKNNVPVSLNSPPVLLAAKNAKGREGREEKDIRQAVRRSVALRSPLYALRPASFLHLTLPVVAPDTSLYILKKSTFLQLLAIFKMVLNCIFEAPNRV